MLLGSGAMFPQLFLPVIDVKRSAIAGWDLHKCNPASYQCESETLLNLLASWWFFVVVVVVVAAAAAQIRYMALPPPLPPPLLLSPTHVRV